MRYLLGLALVLGFTAPARADTINHVEALGSFFGGQQTFAASFDWDVTANKLLGPASLLADGIFNGPFSTRFVDSKQAIWFGPNGENFQIDFRNYWPTIQNTFNNEGSFSLTFLEFFCNQCAPPSNTFWAESGHFFIDPISAPEPSSILLTLAGLLILILACLK